MGTTTEAGAPSSSSSPSVNDVSAIVAAASEPLKASMDGPVKSSTAGYDWASDSGLVELHPWPGRNFADVVAGAPSVVSVPGVVDIDGNPARVAVRYAEFGGLEFG
ncbi:hypothetical protein SAMN06264364_13524 [Quadrisphaera granulorum]|uniref:Uncharacterized protein n=1 Tax=Quadrisphaera granulorum TaxID=317664 RepID=A0A315ZQ71_9ACTN|nr:hypothetical protein [Quadrisphaera granulorum]PWJ47721.1 hypothetical protein BXY45_13524 [Quadrisphaera granulorum]SZE98675.1 hypothetical protein SAMN06264364_13524 [Quadrisphaera granulorum]